MAAIAQEVLGAAVRALGVPGLLDGQKNLGMGVPQVHAGHGTGQRQVPGTNLVFVLRVGGYQVFVNSAGS